MKWLRTFTLVTRSSVHGLLARFENPERMLHQLILDMEEELERVRRSVARAMADEAAMGKDIDREGRESERWSERAAQALKRGREDLAREALDQKHRVIERTAQLEEAKLKMATETGRLRASLRDLEGRVREARNRRTLLLARMRSTEAQRAIQGDAMAGGLASASAEFERLERRVEEEEGAAEAYQELTGENVVNVDLEAAFRAENRREDVERELQALRGRLATQDDGPTS